MVFVQDSTIMAKVKMNFRYACQYVLRRMLENDFLLKANVDSFEVFVQESKGLFHFYFHSNLIFRFFYIEYTTHTNFGLVSNQLITHSSQIVT